MSVWRDLQHMCFQVLLTGVCIPRLCTQIETSSIPRIMASSCCNIEIINIITSVKVTFHDLREFDAASLIVFSVLDERASIFKALVCERGWIRVGWMSREIKNTY